MSLSRNTRRSALPAICLTAVMTVGCAAPARGPAVPQDLEDMAVISGMPAGIRTWGGVMRPEFETELLKGITRERTYRAQLGETGPLPPAHYLAISGGGSDGAFGAGLLCGWTKAGTRPTFKVVTGVSTGALTAPFAFLGSTYDGPMGDIYTNVTTEDILVPRGLLAGLLGDALADNQPLKDLLARLVDQEMLEAVAAEHEKGRVLIVATANLDARRPVLWNLALIAASGHPDSLELFRKLMIASAAIPAAFPPVMMDVEADGKTYQEMHVDGGAMTQVFLYPSTWDFKEVTKSAGVERERRLYVIRNSRLDPEWAQVDRRTLTIAGRAISSLIQSQGMGDLYRIFLSAKRDGIDYNLACIPADFKVESKEEFDREYMNALFKVGYDLAVKGYPWEKGPPGFAE